jgi:ornithine carbamoyltransferase
MKTLPTFSETNEAEVVSLKNRSFIDLRDFNRNEIEFLLDQAQHYKLTRNQSTNQHQDSDQVLERKTLGMLFSVASTRTRISFQVAARQLGGHAEHYNAADLQLSNHEELKDTAAVMGRYLDGLIVRMYDMTQYGKGRASQRTLAEHSGIPVINALDDKDHPSQVMADLFTLREKYGDRFRQKTVVMAWGYSKRQKSLGVLHSMMSAGSLLGMNLRFVHPRGFELDPEYISFAQAAVRKSGGSLEFCNDLTAASEGADVIYVKNWKSLTMSSDQEQAFKEDIRDQWCVNSDHFERANPGAYYMDCMPFIRGEQVTAAVADGPNSIVYDQAENRLYIQKAILASIF